ncbi:V-set domain-containing T-cell activation inhibitor 1-like [Plectropomus leopardus]|uniref:V-set domain-containing T-cell activation inhibitor 1-like n=1 Tax=Plectropomus leopardus TaxID=160734 RepID=UPI001C4C3EE6|nr:V-set domain-containing T-cell activation inhibitor 1-like [Plectropomus leopardus]
MASLGQIIFGSMITLIILFSAIIILILALSFSGNLSEVRSSSMFPIANLGDDKLLSCYLNTAENNLREVKVTWEKQDLTGLVYQYANGAPELTDQNSQFKERTQLFPDALLKGNASLLLRSVTSRDDGQYTCSISSSGGGGKVDIHLRTAAFSAPTFKFSDGVLTAQANRWLPKPNVTWTNYDGDFLVGSSSFTQNSAGIFSVVSTLPSVNISDTYTCRIGNKLVTSVSRATVTDSGVLKNTYFTYSAAPSLLASTYLSIMTAVLCICYLT